MKQLCLVLLIALGYSPIFSQSTTQDKKDKAEILNMLKKQEAAWNTGNLDDFMIGYWNNDSLLFIGKSGPKYGYTTTLENYKKSYSDTAQMGKFTSTIISVQKLSPQYYFVVGKWFLKRSVGDISGHFTLLLKKIKGQWVIVADHSS